MLYDCTVYKATANGEVFWTAESQVLNGCVAQGDTFDEAVTELEENERAWLETAKDLGWKIPEQPIKPLITHSGKFALITSPMLGEEHKHCEYCNKEWGMCDPVTNRFTIPPYGKTNYCPICGKKLTSN